MGRRGSALTELHVLARAVGGGEIGKKES